jgi:pimeloyl-ACP methyl ester carboxylesterase
MGDGSDADDWNAADPARRRLVTPAVLVHGDEDDVVPIGLAQAWLAARTTGDAPARLVGLAGVGHFELIDPDHPAFAEVFRAVRELSSRR